jgi:tellurite resistance protein
MVMANENDVKPISHHTALIYVMVIVSAADREMTDAEMRAIGEEVQRLPIFRDYDVDMLPRAAGDCASILQDEEGLDTVLGIVKSALPEKLRETAYVLACDVAVADGRLSQEELRLLQMVRHALDLDRLHSAAIERAARARYATA